MCQIFPAKLEHDLFSVCTIQNHVSFYKTEKCCNTFFNTFLGYSISFRQINDTSTEIHINNTFFTVWYKNISTEPVRQPRRNVLRQRTQLCRGWFDACLGDCSHFPGWNVYLCSVTLPRSRHVVCNPSSCTLKQLQFLFFFLPKQSRGGHCPICMVGVIRIAV